MHGKNEIGSEFWDFPQAGENGLFPSGTAWFLSGRWALDFVLTDLLTDFAGPRTAALPSWCCETMIAPFLNHGFSVRFYPVLPDSAGGLQVDFSRVMDCGVLLAMDHFGYGSALPSAGFQGVVIRDATHSLFRTAQPNDGDYVFGSLRKWAGFWTGGYAWRRAGKFRAAPPGKTEEAYVSLRRRAMEEKRDYLEGRRPDKEYLDCFTRAEELLDREGGTQGAAARDISAARYLDVELLRRKRRENAAVLLEGVSHMALFPRLGEGDCPLFVPILVPGGKRDALRRFLIGREIYCPVHWPVSVLHLLTEEERQLYEGELSLICDQRYGLADMERTLTAIQDFFRGEDLGC